MSPEFSCSGAEMVGKVGKSWVIFYAGTQQIFDGPFRSRKAAAAKLEGLSAFDRMVMNGRPPASVTDKEFMVGTENGRQFQKRPEVGNFYRRVAEREGQNIKGKKYISQLARYPGDPEAWVSGRGDVQARCDERGWGCDGSVKVKAKEAEEAAKPVDVAPDILEREVLKAKEGKTMTKRQAEDLTHAVKEKLTPSWKKK